MIVIKACNHIILIVQQSACTNNILPAAHTGIYHVLVQDVVILHYSYVQSRDCGTYTMDGKFHYTFKSTTDVSIFHPTFDDLMLSN